MKAICPKCNSTHLRKKGVIYSKGYETNMQRYVCHTCKKQFQVPKGSPKVDLPKILLFDIETSFYHITTFGLYEQRPNFNQITKYQYIISWAAKWLYDENVLSDIVTPQESLERDDKRILESIWNLLDEADIVIGHNVEQFDIRKLNWGFILHHMKPPSPFRTIDTLKHSRKIGYPASHKLDDLRKAKGKKGKRKTDYSLWQRCEEGNQQALDEMLKYNKQDVTENEEEYLDMRPFIKNHPNLGVLMDMDVCPNCGCEHLDETEATYFTSANQFPVYRCQGCKTPYIRHKKNSNYVQTNMRSVPK